MRSARTISLLVVIGSLLALPGQVATGAPADPSSVIAPKAQWKADSDQSDAAFGGSVSTAGDVNGDGFEDVIVGAQYYDNGQFEEDEGRAFVSTGRRRGCPLLPPGPPRAIRMAPISGSRWAPQETSTATGSTT